MVKAHRINGTASPEPVGGPRGMYIASKVIRATFELAGNGEIGISFHDLLPPHNLDLLVKDGLQVLVQPYAGFEVAIRFGRFALG